MGGETNVTTPADRHRERARALAGFGAFACDFPNACQEGLTTREWLAGTVLAGMWAGRGVAARPGGQDAAVYRRMAVAALRSADELLLLLAERPFGEA